MANIIKIADFSDEALDFYVREKEAQLKHTPGGMGRGMFIAESPIVIERALAAGMSRYHFSWKKRTTKSRGGNLLQNTRRFQFLQHRFDVLTKITGFKLTERDALCDVSQRTSID